MSTTAAIATPLPDSNSAHKRSASFTRSTTLPSRPTTPLRSASRTSLRASQTTPTHHLLDASSSSSSGDFPLTVLEPAFSELSDAMADLEANFMHLQLLHESLGRFNENFAAFLYGMNMSAFCVDFSEAPVTQSFASDLWEERRRDQMGDSPFLTQQQQQQQQMGVGMGMGVDATFLTSDTSFVNDPPPTVVKKSGGGGGGGGGAGKFSGVPGSAAKVGGGGGSGVGRGNGIGRGRAGSGIARGTSSSRGRGSADRGRAGSGIGRGIPRGRGVK